MIFFPIHSCFSHNIEENYEEYNENIDMNGNYACSLYANNCFENQSTAVYKNYLFLVPNYREIIYIYSIKNKELLYSYTMEAMKELNGSGSILYHCNNTCFGTDYYDVNDFFPLLYISQRARSDKRCFTEVFRIVANKSSKDSEFSSFKLELVQTIYFPPMSKSNSMGNVNTVIDRENKLLYTYSRNNSQNDTNYRQCKISCFSIPDIHQSEVYLEDTDIRNSYMLNISALYMQGACIEGDYLYIARGSKNVGYIDINIIDLNTQKIVKQLDLLSKGYRWEPEGCFFYDGHLMISSGNNIWKLDNVSGIVDISDEQITKSYYYNINGIQLYAPQKGVNIVRYQTNDGTEVIRKINK